ncbi:hypothetical protein MKX03_024145 [Papaver bracteatum]|nr:hypothetical protein MKX03_024145 [Papaver bracteatum]
MASKATKTNESGVSPPKNRDTQAYVNAKLVGKVLNKEEKIIQKVLRDSHIYFVTFILEDETDRIDHHKWVCDDKDLNETAVIENETYAEIHAHNLKDFEGGNLLEAFSVRPVTDVNQVANHCIESMCAHCQISGSGIPSFAEVKRQVLEYLSMPEPMALGGGVHLDDLMEHCKVAFEDIMVVLDILELEDLVYQPRNSYYKAFSGCRYPA